MLTRTAANTRPHSSALDDASHGKFSVLIVWALDRMTRDGAEGALRILRTGLHGRVGAGVVAERLTRSA